MQSLITRIMENRQALKLIEKIQKELFKDNFEVSEIVTDLKKLREITLELNNPVVTKALRLAYEHLENNNGFFIGILYCNFLEFYYTPNTLIVSLGKIDIKNLLDINIIMRHN